MIQNTFWCDKHYYNYPITSRVNDCENTRDPRKWDGWRSYKVPPRNWSVIGRSLGLEIISVGNLIYVK
jgi:hypothetical protein